MHELKYEIEEKRQRLDATPTKKEDGEDSNQIWIEQQGNNSSADGNMDENADRDDNKLWCGKLRRKLTRMRVNFKKIEKKWNESKDEQGGGGDQDWDHEQSSDSSPSNSSES